MQRPLSYRHRVITDDDLVFIRRLIAENAACSRWGLSRKLCNAWNWVQANGALRDMVCRGMMLMLHRQGLIELPALRQVSRNPLLQRKRPEGVSIDQTPLSMSFAELGPLQVLPKCGARPRRVMVPHLASHILGRMTRTLSADWQRLYAHPSYFVETFIDPQRFRGTCYRAANWTLLGQTTGRGKDAPTRQASRSIKEVLGYPLVADFRQRLSQVGA